MPREFLHRSLARALRVFVGLVRTHFGLTIPQLQEEVHVSRRTIYRYLNAITACGIQIVVEMRETGQLARRILDIHGRHTRITA